MRKETLSQRKARMTNQSNEFQNKWKYYVLKYGPIIDEPFVNDYRARIQLINILDGMDRLNESVLSYKIDKLIDYCFCDRDYMIYYFLLGLFYERMGMYNEAIYMYENILLYGYNDCLFITKLTNLYQHIKHTNIH